MTAQARNHYVIVDITLKERGTSSTQIWSFCNRPIVESTSRPLFATLKEISGLEVQLSPSGIPNKANGVIVLVDNPGTIGQDRRFVDILQRWEIVERPCAVRVLAVDPSGAAPTASQMLSGGETVWSGKITNWSKEIDGEEELLTLETEGATIERKSMSLPLDSYYTDEPSALGKNLQIVFSGSELNGSTLGAQVQAYSSGTVEAPNVRYYYAAGMGDPARAKSFTYPTLFDASYPPTNEPHIWIQNSDRGYEPIDTGGSSSTWEPNATLGTITITAPGTAEYAVKHYGFSGIIIGFRMSFNGLGVAVTPGGQIKFRCYQSKSSGSVFPGDEVVAEATVEKSVYHSALSGASDFWVECRFETPVVVPYNSGVETWYSIQLSSYVPGSDFVPSGAASSLTIAAQRGSNNEWAAASGTVALADYLLCGLSEGSASDGSGATGIDANQAGFTAWYLQLEPLTPPAHAENPDLSDLDIVICTDGILDATSSGVGAGAGVQIQRPDHAIRLLSRTFDGADWVDPSGGYLSNWSAELDAALGSSSRYRRIINGQFGGDATADDVIEAICEEHGIKYVPISNGLALWAWGTSYPTAFVFNDENSRVESYRCEGKETVINDVELSVEPALIIANSARQSNQKNGGYKVSFKFRTAGSPDGDHEYSEISADSIATYGRNRNRKQEARFLYGETSARSIGNYLIRNYDRPDIEIEWSCPYIQGVTDLPVASVVEIVSTALPAYFGANPDAQAPSYNGELSTLFGGIIAVRAERHRVQILGKKIEIDDDGFRIKYRGRLIGAYHPYDPT